MDEPPEPVRCPKCRTLVPVVPGWRIAQCPQCGEMVTRMGEDRSYD